MTEVRKFSLLPFPGDRDAGAVRIEGSIVRRGNLLSIAFSMLGPVSEIAIPVGETFPARKNRLWETTCFELFVAVKGSANYWEFNFSPGGNWNVFSFADTRAGMKEEKAYSSLQPVLRIEQGALKLSLDLDIGRIIPKTVPLEVAVCAVLENKNGGKSHWALAHPALRPDFHLRDGFRLSFPGPAS